MTQKRKYWQMTKREAWALATKLAALPHIGNIEKVAELIECAVSTVYRWGSSASSKTYPSAQFIIPLRDLAIREGIIKA